MPESRSYLGGAARVTSSDPFDLADSWTLRTDRPVKSGDEGRPHAVGAIVNALGEDVTDTPDYVRSLAWDGDGHAVLTVTTTGKPLPAGGRLAISYNVAPQPCPGCGKPHGLPEGLAAALGALLSRDPGIATGPDDDDPDSREAWDMINASIEREQAADADIYEADRVTAPDDAAALAEDIPTPRGVRIERPGADPIPLSLLYVGRTTAGKHVWRTTSDVTLPVNERFRITADEAPDDVHFFVTRKNGSES